MWDSVANKGAQNIIKYFNRKLSFDQKDCNEYGMIFRPLFYANNFNRTDQKLDYTYDFCFIGTVHSDRATILKSIQDYCEKNGLTYYYYLYVPGKFMYHARRLLSKSFREFDPKYIHTDSITHDKVSEIENQSRCIIDINHPKQTGLTMRTIEMVGLKRKILTTNEHVLNYDFYRPEDEIVIDRNHVRINKEMLRKDYVELSTDVYNKYSIESWVEDIFDLNGGK